MDFGFEIGDFPEQAILVLDDDIVARVIVPAIAAGIQRVALEFAEFGLQLDEFFCWGFWDNVHNRNFPARAPMNPPTMIPIKIPKPIRSFSSVAMIK